MVNVVWDAYLGIQVMTVHKVGHGQRLQMSNDNAITNANFT